MYKNNKDGSLWQKRMLCNYGEYVDGLMRLPELNFGQLWELLIYPTDDFNKLGSVSLFEEKYGAELNKYLKQYIIENDFKRICHIKKGLSFLKKNAHDIGYLKYGNDRKYSEEDRQFYKNIWGEIFQMTDQLLDIARREDSILQRLIKCCKSQ